MTTNITVGDFSVDLSRVEADGDAWVGEVVITVAAGDVFTMDYEQTRDYEGVLTVAPLTAAEEDEPGLVELYAAVLGAKDELEKAITAYLGDPLVDVRREAMDEDRTVREAILSRSAA